MSVVLGIDIASNTGVAALEAVGVGTAARGIKRHAVGLIRLGETRGARRIASFFDGLLPWFEVHRPALVVFEDYGGMRFAKHAILAAELGGTARLICAAAGVPYVAVPPATLKVWVCGQWKKAAGPPTKERMCVRVAERWGYGAETSDDADAFAAATVGIHILHPGPDLKAIEKEIVDRYAEKIVRAHIPYEGRLSGFAVRQGGGDAAQEVPGTGRPAAGA